ncbi:hypothetical protein [Gryllotalpicola koreensis]|uniref:Asp23/Gls24 family envelope stress response protein n=1 Tax=Gryllotalpicola koreensis TaxID=993086 RepID=A0ABP7ZZE4_9MICO
MTAVTTLSDRLTAVVLAAPDVHTLYPPKTALHALGAKLIAGEDEHRERAPKVTVSETRHGTTIKVSVGLTGEHPATSVCRNLHDIIATELAAAGATLPLNIAVRIATISTQH